MARKRGQKPKPTAKHKLDGTYRPTRHEGRTEAEYPDGSVQPPECLGEAAVAEWERVVPLLVSAGVWTEADRMALRIYCQAVAEYNALSAVLDGLDSNTYTTPTGDIKTRPEVGERQKAYAILKDTMARFGFTPTDRVGLPAAPPAKPESDDEDFFGDGLSVVK